MMYVFDLVFVALFMIIQEWQRRLMDCKLRWYFEIREVIAMAQWLLVMIYCYFRPCHTDSEKQVSVFASLFFISVFTYLVTKKKII